MTTPDAPLKYAILVDPNSTVTPDFVGELERAGGDCKLFPLSVGEEQIIVEGYQSVTELFGDLLNYEPDAVLSINRKGASASSALVVFCEVYRIPLLLWYMDNPFYLDLPAHERDFDSLVYVNFDPYYVEPLREWGAKNVSYVPVGSNPEHFTAPAVHKKKKKKSGRKYPITFVGSLGILHLQRILKRIEVHMDGLYPYFKDEVQREVEAGGKWQHEHSREMPFIFLDELIDEGRPLAPFMKNPRIKQLMAGLIDFQATFDLRVRYAKKLLPLGLHVWGDDAWKLVLPPDRFHGKVPWAEVQGIYRKSQLVLNVTRFQIFRAVTQRFFDVPLSGSVLFSDDRLSVDEFFEPGEEVLLFHGPDDIEAKAAEALADPERLAAIGEKARKKIQERHTYAHRIPELDAVVRDGQEFLREAGPPSFDRQPGLVEMLDEVFAQWFQTGWADCVDHVLKQLKPANREQADWLAWRGGHACETGDWDGAQEFLDRALASDPSHRVANRYRAIGLQREGRHDEAVGIIRQHLAKNTNCEQSRALNLAFNTNSAGLTDPRAGSESAPKRTIEKVESA